MSLPVVNVKVGEVRQDPADLLNYRWDGSTWVAEGTGTPTSAALPTTGNEAGDVREDKTTGRKYRWTGSAWSLIAVSADTDNDVNQDGIPDLATMLEAITRGSILVGGVANAPTELVAKTDANILIGTGTDLVSVALSGDATIDNTGLLTIEAGAVTLAKMANLARGSLLVGGAANAVTALDANNNGYILVGDGTDLKSVAVSGDITVTNAGVTAIGADKVSLAMMKANSVGKNSLKYVLETVQINAGTSGTATVVAGAQILGWYVTAITGTERVKTVAIADTTLTVTLSGSDTATITVVTLED